MTVRMFARREKGRDGNETDRSVLPHRPHFSSRTALVSLYAFVAAVLTGFLSFAGHHIVVTGAVAFGGAFSFFDKIIGD